MLSSLNASRCNGVRSHKADPWHIAAAALVGALLSTAPPIAAANTFSFEDVTTQAGFTYRGESWGASWGDLNGDDWPDLFTSNHRLRAAIYRNDAGTFTDVTKQVDGSGLYKSPVPPDDTHGAAWGDFDNDGDQDLFVNTQINESPHFLVNDKPAGKLFNEASTYGFSDDYEGQTPAWIDYNNDGLLDLLSASRNKIRVWQQGPTSFSDQQAVVKSKCIVDKYIQFSDLNGDGVLDVVCGQESGFPDLIYDITVQPWKDITSVLPSKVNPSPDSAIADFNNDLRSDVFVLKGMLRPSEAALTNDQLTVEAWLTPPAKKEQGFSFATNGSITFDYDTRSGGGPWSVYIGASGTHPAAVPFTVSPEDAVGMKPHDPAVNRGTYIGFDPASGRWTILSSSGATAAKGYYFTSSKSIIFDLQQIGLRAVDKPVRPSLFMYKDGVFVDSAQAAGLGLVSCGSVVAGDFNNDMYVDLFLACRGGARNLPNILLANTPGNNGTRKFVPVLEAGGARGVIGTAITDGAGTSESVVMADYNLDGFLDLFVTNGNNLQPFKLGGPVQLFRNKGNANKRILIDLVCKSSNRDCIGARVVASTPDNVTQLREQNGGYHRWSQDHKRLHFGLAGNSSVDLAVTWPDGTVSTFNGVSANRLYRILEDDGSIAAVRPL